MTEAHFYFPFPDVRLTPAFLHPRSLGKYIINAPRRCRSLRHGHNQHRQRQQRQQHLSHIVNQGYQPALGQFPGINRPAAKPQYDKNRRIDNHIRRRVKQC